jgi:hypothetical protein
LSWHLQPWAWGAALLLVPCVALKGSLLALPDLSVLKKPLDAAEVVENKVSGAVAMPLVAKSTAAALALPLAGAVAGVVQLALPTAHAASPRQARPSVELRQPPSTGWAWCWRPAPSRRCGW